MKYSPNMSVPADVPAAKKSLYQKNLKLLTKGTGRLFIFPGDQRVEHLNNDFFGPAISADDADPEHLFRIAASSRIGGFAAQMGLIARYGADYKKIPYIVKLNSKTNLVENSEQDPYSAAWYDVRQVVEFAKLSKLTIPAVGYTVYIGSKFEAAMLREAAQIVWQAHQAGLVAILWNYPLLQVHSLLGFRGDDRRFGYYGQLSRFLVFLCGEQFLKGSAPQSAQLRIVFADPFFLGHVTPPFRRAS
jgi:fructose-bisphosphate aldolase/6-deoxy-5-ketofructose 1-phosphate synthase